MPAANDAPSVAARLLDAHVAHQVGRLRGGAFADTVGAEIDFVLARAAEVSLDQVIHRDQVKAVASKYVASFELPAAIPELVGEIAGRLRVHPAQQAALGEVIDRRHVTALVDKIAELPALRQAIATRIAENPSVQAWLAQYLHSLATSPIAANRRLAKKVPGVSSALAVGERLTGGVLREADQRSRELAERTAAGILHRWRSGMAESLADEEFAEALLSLWDQTSGRRLSELLSAADEDDLVDFVAIGYELWLDLRGTDYLHSLIDTGVDYFFDTYGTFSLAQLLQEFELDRDDLIEEALRFAPAAIAGLDEAGLLEALVRRQLASFYDSPEALAAITAPSRAPGAARPSPRPS